MSVSDVFKALTHFRLQRVALTENSTDSAYNVSVKSDNKASTKSKRFQGSKNKREAKKYLKCITATCVSTKPKTVASRSINFCKYKMRDSKQTLPPSRTAPQSRRRLQPSRVNWILLKYQLYTQ
ncbi:hypothetical protein V1517DRAFT_331837 [Lipomyces orientalis]|uniref:Uncharacterized protein n=1 Tax=Lipomyces orientalis TaxID=1233043 RepID=A0ACC3TF88_9ASCO